MIGFALGLAALGAFAYARHHRRHHWAFHQGHAFGRSCYAGHAGPPDDYGPSHHHHHHRRGWGWRGGPYFLMRVLGTTPGQEKVIREEAELMRERGRLAREEVTAAKGDLAEVVRAETFDRARYDAALSRVDAAWAGLKNAAGDSIARIHETLDARQRERLAEMLASSRRGGPGFGPFR